MTPTLTTPLLQEMQQTRSRPGARTKSVLPHGFRELVNDMLQSVIVSRPLDLNKHFALYLEAELDKRTLFELQCAVECELFIIYLSSFVCLSFCLSLWNARRA